MDQSIGMNDIKEAPRLRERACHIARAFGFDENKAEDIAQNAIVKLLENKNRGLVHVVIDAIRDEYGRTSEVNAKTPWRVNKRHAFLAASRAGCGDIEGPSGDITNALDFLPTDPWGKVDAALDLPYHLQILSSIERRLITEMHLGGATGADLALEMAKELDDMNAEDITYTAWYSLSKMRKAARE